MSASLISKESIDLISQVPDGIVITPNLRLQRRFLLALSRQMEEDGCKAWTPPLVVAMSSWLDDKWQDAQIAGVTAVSKRRVLSAAQQQHLWQNIIAADSTASSLIQNSAAATAAADAYARLVTYQVPDSQITGETPEAARFLEWRAEFDASLNAHHWVTRERCTELLIEAIENGDIDLPGTVFLFEFDDIPPIYSALFHALRAAGVDIREVGYHSNFNNAVRVGVTDRNEQYILAARWARAALKADPNLTIGVVVPELQRDREEVVASFNSVFERDAVLPFTPRYTQPFNVSAGVPLGTVPVVKEAAFLLGLANGANIEIADACRLIRTPFIAGSTTEFSARATLAARLRESAGSAIPLDGIVSRAGRLNHLAEGLRSFSAVFENTHRSLRPSQWAICFSSALEAIGWPGERPTDSEEYQAVVMWNETLDAFSGLDDLTGHCSRRKALGLLARVLANRVFQPETGDSPVQVLGTLEAAGLRFDRLWVADFNDDVFPPAPSPNPMLSLALQRSFDMPHSSADRELAFCSNLATRFISGADEVVISFAQWDDDRELRHAQLIESVPEVTVDDLTLAVHTPLESLLLNRAELATVQDEAKPVANHEIEHIGGGTGIIKAQSACPFSAFAKYRLKAREIRESKLGLDHFERGQLLHTMMEYIWTQYTTQAQLAGLGEEGRDELIAEACQVAFRWLEKERTDIGPRLRDIESRRMTKIVTDWLGLELARPGFRVDAVEQRVVTHIGGLPLTLSRDRVDVMDTGERVHMDYKTGKKGPSAWVGERPKDPQIPIYIATDSEPVHAAAFGLLRSGEVAMVGVGESDRVGGNVIPIEKNRSGLDKSWTDQVGHWNEAVTGLAEDFMEGSAGIDPAWPDTCDNCHLSGLCRKV